MTEQSRKWGIRKGGAVAASLLLGAVMVAGMAGLAAPSASLPQYGALMTEISLSELNSLNIVSGVLFDLRALDTLGEMLIIFTASAGLIVMLRRMPGEKRLNTPRWALRSRPAVPVSEAVRSVCFTLAAATAFYGVYLTVRGHITVGGGFQGGVMIAAALIFIYLAGRYDVQKQIANADVLELIDSIGMGGYVVMGLAGLAFAGSFLANVLSPGTAGYLISAGAIPVLSILVGIEAFAAIILIVKEMQEQQLERVMVQAGESAGSGVGDSENEGNGKGGDPPG